MPRDGLPVCDATLGLLRASGQRTPVPVVTDDFQWLDGVSLECVLYAARRAPGAVAFALAEREAEGADRRGADLLALRPGRPGHKNSLQVLSCVAADLAMPVAGARVHAAAGSLLALIELPAPLSREQRACWARLGRPPTPGAAPPTVRPPGQRAAWLRAARAGGCNLRGRRPDYDVRACARAGTEAGLLACVKARELVRVGEGRLAFGHPLSRGAVYNGASAETRTARSLV